MRLILIFFSLIYLYASDLEIVKYVSNQPPKILVEYQNLPYALQRILRLDSKIISHYVVDFGIENHISNIKSEVETDNYKGYNYLLRLNWTNNQLQAILYDLHKHVTLLYKLYNASSYSVYPFVIHALSYDINNKLGFDDVGWIKQKIVYSIYTAPKEQDIFLADVTLTYRKKLISGGLNVFPKWANPQQTEIYYTKLETQPVLYRYNIYTGERKRVLSSKGMLIVSDVNGDELLLTLAVDDQPDIYRYNTINHSLTRLTKFAGIDVNGQFYDNDKIVFISDRLGYPNVYQKDLNTNKVSKLIHHGRNHIAVSAYHDNVVLSSRETNYAFSPNTFNLLLINKNTNFIKRLTYGGKNFLPTFSSDGGTILFIKEQRFNSKLGIIRLKENKIFYFKISKKMQSFDF
ncbi:MAG: translocation protein TolB [Epsilonproteobacteria bacterium]|nr:translocation protein TolB [Campylobacterota bacterium]